MLTRRNFIRNSAALPASIVVGNALAAEQFDNKSDAGKVMPTQGNIVPQPLPTNPAGSLLPYRFGFGGVAIGNGFAAMTDKTAQQALQAAWDSGVRYFDTSPFYGSGLSEQRMGYFLHNQDPSEYVVSTKIGRVYHAATEPKPEHALWKSPAPFDFEYDYTADGTKRSIEDSLLRMGIPKINYVFIHDLSPDNPDFGDTWEQQFEIARKGAMPALEKLREEGVIDGWGFGVNRPQPIVKALEVANPNIFLIATQYSLLEHQEPLKTTLPLLEKHKASVVIGAPLLAGFLSGRERYLYGPTVPPEALEKRSKMQAVANQFGIDLRTASLQFTLAHPAVSAVIPGIRTSEQAEANAKSFSVQIPTEFWQTLKQQDLIHPDAPVPA